MMTLTDILEQDLPSRELQWAGNDPETDTHPVVETRVNVGMLSRLKIKMSTPLLAF